jgi:hypothetical protein
MWKAFATIRGTVDNQLNWELRCSNCPQYDALGTCVHKYCLEQTAEEYIIFGKGGESSLCAKQKVGKCDRIVDAPGVVLCSFKKEDPKDNTSLRYKTIVSVSRSITGPLADPGRVFVRHYGVCTDERGGIWLCEDCSSSTRKADVDRNCQHIRAAQQFIWKENLIPRGSSDEDLSAFENLLHTFKQPSSYAETRTEREAFSACSISWKPISVPTFAQVPADGEVHRPK